MDKHCIYVKFGDFFYIVLKHVDYYNGHDFNQFHYTVECIEFNMIRNYATTYHKIKRKV